ncbi:MAG: hypothetical protein EXR02_08630 [Rhodospirillales bacterium]|nr:hypothetical protein [Rhodospirillales bacterium]MSP81106.1 hypothetical protein [Rhodospirillales bacterium]
MSKAGKRILTSVREALAFVEGKADKRRFKVHVPESLNVAAIRRSVPSPAVAGEGAERKRGG